MQLASFRKVLLRPLASESQSPDVLSDALLWLRVGNAGAALARLHVASLALDSQGLQSTLLLNRFLKSLPGGTDTAYMAAKLIALLIVLSAVGVYTISLATRADAPPVSLTPAQRALTLPDAKPAAQDRAPQGGSTIGKRTYGSPTYAPGENNMNLPGDDDNGLRAADPCNHVLESNCDPNTTSGDTVATPTTSIPDPLPDCTEDELGNCLEDY